MRPARGVRAGHARETSGSTGDGARRIERSVPNQDDRAGEPKEGKTEVSIDESPTRASKQPVAAASALTHMHPAWRVRRRPCAGLLKRQQRGMELPVLG